MWGCTMTNKFILSLLFLKHRAVLPERLFASECNKAFGNSEFNQLERSLSVLDEQAYQKNILIENLVTFFQSKFRARQPRHFEEIHV